MISKAETRSAPPSYPPYHRVGVALVILIVLLHGSFFRFREPSVPPTLDWLNVLRLLVLGFGFLAGVYLFPRRLPLGFGAKSLFIYYIIVVLSAVGSALPITVLGYAYGKICATMLMAALIYNVRNVQELKQVENIWFYTVIFILAKDTLLAVILQPELARETGRLGMGITHANTFGAYAVSIIIMSIKPDGEKISPYTWLLRLAMVLILYFTKSRTSIMSLMFGLFAIYLFNHQDILKGRIKMICLTLLAVSFGLFIYFNNIMFAGDIIGYMQRGQDVEEISTLTYRTFIWDEAWRHSMEHPILGHGFAITQFTLGTRISETNPPAHAHNEWLEALYGTGILGLIAFSCIMIYSLKWLFRFNELKNIFTGAVACHAVGIVASNFFGSILEVGLTDKIQPFYLLFLFYLLTLDKLRHIQRV